MAKGYEAHQQRQMALSAFGKELARRAKSKCELSGAAGIALRIYEIPPAPQEPDISKCLMLSEDVVSQLEAPAKINADSWHHLRELAWSDIPAVQIMCHRLLTYLAEENNWAQDLLGELIIDEELIEFSNKSKLA